MIFPLIVPFHFCGLYAVEATPQYLTVMLGFESSDVVDSLNPALTPGFSPGLYMW